MIYQDTGVSEQDALHMKSILYGRGFMTIFSVEMNIT